MAAVSNDAVQPLSVLQGDPGGLLGGDAPQLAQLPGHIEDLARIVALAPEGDGGHVGAVRFDDDAVQGDICRHLDGLPGILEGQHTRKADIPTPLDQLLRHLQ